MLGDITKMFGTSSAEKVDETCGCTAGEGSKLARNCCSFFCEALREGAVVGRSVSPLVTDKSCMSVVSSPSVLPLCLALLTLCR
jgi:hypothetical protein